MSYILILEANIRQESGFFELLLTLFLNHWTDLLDNMKRFLAPPVSRLIQVSMLYIQKSLTLFGRQHSVMTKQPQKIPQTVQ